MKFNKLVYALFIIMLVAFLSIYFGTTNVKDYVTNTSKDYSNKITDFGDGMSSFIFDMVNGVLKGSFKVVEKMIN